MNETQAAERTPFIAAIATPVAVRIPGVMHPGGRTVSVPAEKLAEDVVRHGPMGLTFEGPTI